MGVKIQGGAGGRESESVDNVSVVGLYLKEDGSVVLNPRCLNVENF